MRFKPGPAARGAWSVPGRGEPLPEVSRVRAPPREHVEVVTWPLLLSLLLAQAEPPFPVQFEGNVALPDEVYAAVLRVPPEARPEPATAQAVGTQVEQFLLRSGYELARVDVTVERDGLVVHIDEGRLERLVFRGRFTLRLLRFRLALDLPQNVFNRPHLEREVAERARALGIEAPRWALVSSSDPRHEGVQLESPPGVVLRGRPLFRPPARFELHFTFGEPTWNTGLGVDLRSSWLNGLELGLNYQGTSGALRDDRWRVALSGGVGLRRDLPRANIYVAPTRVRAELLWASPPLDAQGATRGLVELYGEWFFRQRRDFGLENYAALRTELALGLLTRPHPLLSVRLAGGLQHFWLASLAVGEGASPPAGLLLAAETDPWRLRAFVEAQLELTFFDGGARVDHRHALLLSSRVSANLNRFERPLFVDVRLAYQRVVPLGWHELWFNVKGTWLTGDVLFPFEDVMGQHLPGVFGDVWLQKALGLSVGFRYSLVRDVFKVGLFAKGLAWGEEQREVGTTLLRAGAGAGPSVHLLLLDFFQLDVFVDLAVLSNGRLGAGLLVWLNKVF